METATWNVRCCDGKWRYHRDQGPAPRQHQVQLAHDGPSALHLARSQVPEVVLLDIDLPGGMDGYEVARRLRAEQGLGEVFIIALTGFGLEEDRRRSADAGSSRAA